jgi:hypothetical protein
MATKKTAKRLNSGSCSSQNNKPTGSKTGGSAMPVRVVVQLDFNAASTRGQAY